MRRKESDMREEINDLIVACTEVKRIAEFFEKELASVSETASEEAENSWNFEEGKRIIAQRDKLLKRNNALCDDLDTARNERGAALVESHDMRRQRDTARNDERRVSGERDELRDKLRATEEALDKAEGKVERLEEHECACGVDCNTSLVERNDLRAKLRATEKENCSLVAGRYAAREDAIYSHRKYTRLRTSLRVLVTGESQDDD